MSRVLFALVLASLVGCSTMWPSMPTEEPPTATETQAFVYDFRDIQIPQDMEIQMKESTVSSVAGENYGVLKFKGRVEPISLFDYFANSMPKNGWTLIAYQKYQRFQMIFTKENRVAVLTIEEDSLYSTWLEVWVSPRQNSYGTAPMGAQPFPAAAPTTGGFSKPIEMERSLTQ
ncbi:MAG: hypothetical protein JG774_1414 [Desulfomicrobiaceae bacterium]|jgi:hypothetical protein|nr:hypothetical protein [Desulfomicrobiaceae bacterium]MBZ4648652.1 hypothetical protein [Desulfomicrobiaceae bacterium]MBZ4685669.1 hypothetical protein [Desulfomicrobiaceae bacterium]MDK2873884.1 hypothetical protein [Desulfomicrobiaceae bacterium]